MQSARRIALLTKFGLVVGAVLLASTVHAATIEFSHDGSGLSSIGRGGFYLASELDYFSTDTDDAFGVGFELWTGRAKSVFVDASGASRYFFTGGVATFTFQGKESAFNVLPFTIELSPVTYDPVWGGDGPVALMDMVDVTLGRGTLNPALARALGVKKKVSGGGLSFVVDDVRGKPRAKAREGVMSWMGGSLDVRGKGRPTDQLRVGEGVVPQAVPEPSLLALVAAGTALTLRRRRRA
jgi:hypothetical protein